jgi:hypothetical protein
LIDSVLTAGTKSGYTFKVLPGTTAVTTTPAGCTTGFSDGYGVAGTPVTLGTTGQRSFCTDASGVIRYDATGALFSLTAASVCSAGTGVLGQ